MELLEECRRIGGCATGEAVITSGYNLRAKYIIHAVGPIWHGGNDREDELLRSAYYNSLKLAEEKRILSISFPSIGTGAYGFPVGRAAKIAVKTVNNFLESGIFIKKVVFVLFSDSDYDVYAGALDALK